MTRQDVLRSSRTLNTAHKYFHKLLVVALNLQSDERQSLGFFVDFIMSDAPAVEEGELPSSPLTAEDEDLEEGEILESDNEENGEKEAKKSPEPPPRVGGQKEKEKDREREETSHRNTRKVERENGRGGPI